MNPYVTFERVERALKRAESFVGEESPHVQQSLQEARLSNVKALFYYEGLGHQNNTKHT
ncbi:hypothetical protein G4V62_01815 [Bacillaceae bacterium SIJ1]|uniref:hypothetical protein n=1 Tax=Litoribacterium kuwaitense TaxID=1398745 RepID=UPI0013EA706E|nr:hypothetical protein [Litoribacterium kuwaitense]NGP43760.1 hypothetical protein [Litoribacterium kuwaitense]